MKCRTNDVISSLYVKSCLGQVICRTNDCRTNDCGTNDIAPSTGLKGDFIWTTLLSKIILSTKPSLKINYYGQRLLLQGLKTWFRVTLGFKISVQFTATPLKALSDPIGIRNQCFFFLENWLFTFVDSLQT